MEANEFYEKIGKGVMEQISRTMNSISDPEVTQKNRRDLAVTIAAFVIKKLAADVNEGLWILETAKQVYHDEIGNEN